MRPRKNPLNETHFHPLLRHSTGPALGKHGSSVYPESRRVGDCQPHAAAGGIFEPMKTHTFTLTVKGHISKSRARDIVMVAFAARFPDGCEFCVSAHRKTTCRACAAAALMKEESKA